MLVSDIKVIPSKKWCQLQAQVTTRAPNKPFLLYYRFPRSYEHIIDASIGDPFLTMLLIPAMRAGETLEIRAEISPKLMQATARIQQIFSSWNQELSQITIRAPIRRKPPSAAQGTRRGLFFSCGIDSFYSLLRRQGKQELGRITDLIVICGFDISHRAVSSRVYGKLLENSAKVASSLGIQALPVVTNAREFSDRYIHTFWCQGGLLTSVGLSLQETFQEILVASTYSCDRLVPVGSHPETDPLWSTESLTFVHDGCETSKIDKIRFVANSSLAMETLRVCSQSYATLVNSPRLYNCGMCEKCMRTMVGLHIAGKSRACKTLPHAIDAELLRNVDREERVRSHTEELVETLGFSRDDLMMKAALRDSLSSLGRRCVRKRVLRTGTYLVTRYAPYLMPIWRLVGCALVKVRLPIIRQPTCS